MPRPKPTSSDLEERKQRSEVWKNFRSEFLLTQAKLAEVLEISRRTVQQIEAGVVTPSEVTLRKFAIYRRRCKVSAKEKDRKWLKSIL